MKHWLLVLLACMVAPLASFADEAVSVRIGYQVLMPSGQFAGAVSGIGTRIDIERDLAFGNSQQPIGEMALQLGDSRLGFGIMPLSFMGDGVLARGIAFNGRTYAAGTPVHAELKADIFDIAHTYYIVNMDDLPSRFQLGIETSVKIINAKASMTDTTGAVPAQSVSGVVPIPTVGLRARVALADFVGLVGRVGYLGYAGNRFLDADAQVEFSPLPTLGVYGGYRSLNIRLDASGVFWDTTFQGPYIGGFFRF